MLGANWLSKLGIAALAVATASFLKYAFDSGWIGPTGRVAMGLVGAGVLIGLGQYLLPRPRYRAYAQVLMSGGIIIYFLSVFAAFSFYGLIGWPTAFAALALGALAASAVATANRTEAVAALCLLGAFLTPVLLQEDGGAGASRLAKLYSYLIGVNVWSALLVRARGWHGLTLLSFGATWLIFYGSLWGRPMEPLLFEAFALAFLLFTCYGGAAALAREAKPSPEVGQLAVAMLVLGCLAFAVISVPILYGTVLFGLPALVFAAVVLALLMVGLAIALPELPSGDRAVRRAFVYVSAAALALLIIVAVETAGPVVQAQAPVAFAFTLVSYLLFMGVALHLQRQPGYAGPAIALLLANNLSHIVGVFHALAYVKLWGMGAAAVWLPVAGWLTALTVWAVGREKERGNFRIAVLATAQALPVVALGALALGVRAWRVWPAVGVFGAEFVLLSATWLAARRLIVTPQFRGDLLAAFGNAAAFFGLLAAAAGMREYQGLVVLCGCALALAAYHAVVGANVLRPPKDDLLHRLVYLGLAVTFVTIAVPLQLKASYLTVAWAVESVVLIWTGLAVRDARVRTYGYVLLAVAASRSLFWDIGYGSPDELFLLNLRMLSGGSIVAASAVSAALLARARKHLGGAEHPLLGGQMLMANFFALVFVSVDLWRHLEVTAPVVGRTSAQQLALSIFWSCYALALMSVGIWRRAKLVRLVALGLLYVSILKVFLFDLSALQQPYRIVSFFGLGLILLVVSLLYTRFEERLK